MSYKQVLYPTRHAELLHNRAVVTLSNIGDRRSGSTGKLVNKYLVNHSALGVHIDFKFKNTSRSPVGDTSAIYS